MNPKSIDVLITSKIQKIFFKLKNKVKLKLELSENNLF